MICPFCGHNQDSVVESRFNNNANILRRRRQCLSCHRRFTTYEKIETPSLWIIKRDGSRQIFDKHKIKAGLLKACNKRPVKIDDIDGLIDKVEQELLRKNQSEISSKQIGGAILRRLRHLDEVAYIRFASVYLDFDNINDFDQLINKLDKSHNG